MSVLGILAGIAVVQILAAASPGPNFIIVTSYAISQSRSKPLLVVCGILLATLAWAVLAAGGLGIFLAAHAKIYLALQLLSAGYLIWLGVKMLLHVRRDNYDAIQTGKARPISAGEALRSGFLTSKTNPKSVAYYGSLFVVMIPHDAPTGLFVAAVATAFVTSAFWWVGLALFFSVGPVRASMNVSGAPWMPSWENS
jgi:threonine/homoserine/homoserine lactone efflux protein